MKCSICGSESHLRANCDQRDGGKGGKGGTGAASSSSGPPQFGYVADPPRDIGPLSGILAGVDVETTSQQRFDTGVTLQVNTPDGGRSGSTGPGASTGAGISPVPSITRSGGSGLQPGT